MTLGEGGAYHSHFNAKLDGIPIIAKFPLLV